MKKIIPLMLALGILSVLPAAAQTNSREKILVVYFTRTGNTRYVAEHIQSLLGGDMAEITAVTAYPEIYSAALDRARQERDGNVRPAIRVLVPDINDYEYILLGYPIWLGGIPMPVAAFLETFDFSGKTIMPFCSSGSTGIGQSIEEIKKLVPGAQVTGGFRVSTSGARNSRNDAAAWLRSIGILK
ncbi:flavodoxin [Breznakiella homolactica]|uniref:Flavodoxin n=1 Tax=Breznakiella homolactica TaxID=2798577 RepID=A0A7T7XKC4_9SPIR|nr:flavodoxin [Breznakiella homolactica]QQO07792.1 flavodoxin [Breznakiella homolactica]